MIQLNPNNHYSFDCTGDPLAGRLVLITGITRSGTTLLGNLVGSLKNVEYDFEPWVFHCIPMMVASGQIQVRAAVEIFRGYFNETLTSAVLGRGANFRPTDDTRIWSRLPLDEIFSRWYQITDRWSVKQYVREHKSILGFKLTNFGPFLSLLWNHFPTIKIINILRNPFQLAPSIQKKGWVNLNRLQELEGLPVRKKITTRDGKSIFIPWWVDEADIESFLGMTELARAFYCWRVITEKTESEKKQLGFPSRGEGRYLEVKYEDLVKNPRLFMENLSKFVATSLTPQTEALIQTVKTDRLKSGPDFSLDSITEEEKKRLAKLLETSPYASEVPQFV